MRPVAACLALALAACSDDFDIARYPILPAPAEAERRIAADTIEVRLVSLPLYAEAEEVPQLVADGSVRATADVLWADEPERALSQMLARNLAEITRATAAVEPWPLEAFPDLRLEVRVDELIGPLGGPLRFTGSWFAARPGEPGGDRAGRFDIAVPLEGEGYGALARGYGIATRDLAREIAAAL